MTTRTQRRKTPHGVLPGVLHPHAVPILDQEEVDTEEGGEYRAESREGGLDPDLRERLIRERAYRSFMERGCMDGYDVDDWLQAEAEVNETLLRPHAHGGGASSE